MTRLHWTLCSEMHSQGKASQLQSFTSTLSVIRQAQLIPGLNLRSYNLQRLFRRVLALCSGYIIAMGARPEPWKLSRKQTSTKQASQTRMCSSVPVLRHMQETCHGCSAGKAGAGGATGRAASSRRRCSPRGLDHASALPRSWPMRCLPQRLWRSRHPATSRQPAGLPHTKHTCPALGLCHL